MADTPIDFDPFGSVKDPTYRIAYGDGNTVEVDYFSTMQKLSQISESVSLFDGAELIRKAFGFPTEEDAAAWNIQHPGEDLPANLKYPSGYNCYALMNDFKEKFYELAPLKKLRGPTPS